MRLAAARVVSNDVQRLVRFYQEVLQVDPVGSDDYVEFRTPGATMSISSQRSMEQFGAGATTPGGNRSSILDFEVEDVDEERAPLRRLVPSCVLEPTDQPWGNRSMLFRDPDGNLINIFAALRSERNSRHT